VFRAWPWGGMGKEVIPFKRVIKRVMSDILLAAGCHREVDVVPLRKGIRGGIIL